MVKIRYMEASDQEFWYRLDHHLPEAEFAHKVAAKQGYVLLAGSKPAGLLRYFLFWDSVPFCAMLYIDEPYQRKGYGKQLMEYWEADMKAQGFGMLLTSTQADESAQHFYRKIGYKDCGGMVMDIPGYAQPMEVFFAKSIQELPL